MKKKKRKQKVCEVILLIILLCLIVILHKLMQGEKTTHDEIKGISAITSVIDRSEVPEQREPDDAEKGTMSVSEMGEYIKSHPMLYTEDLLELSEKNEETVEYVYNYPFVGENDFIMDLSEEVVADTVPLLLQWDTRWGYCKYGSGLIGYTGCGPTCLSMVSLFLTGNEKYTPKYIAEYAEREGYYVQGSGTSWELMSSGCNKFGLKATELSLDESVILSALDRGHPIICAMGRGDFTDSGHFIVITGYDGEGLHINDPNSKDRSEKKWEYSQIKWQIRNLWAFQVR